MKRLTDIAVSAAGLVVLFPLMAATAIAIKMDSKGGIFYKQLRVGKNEKPFRILKFRTMAPGADKQGQLTIGSRDSRITRVGFFLRKYKIDELPQLVNVLKGEMSLVGPRPEVPEYVRFYDENQKEVLRVKPGITDYASIAFSNENEILEKFVDPKKAYKEVVMPQKLQMNLEYIKNNSYFTDIKIILKTLRKLFS